MFMNATNAQLVVIQLAHQLECSAYLKGLSKAKAPRTKAK